MGQDYTVEQCLEQARLNRRLAEKAEGEGNIALAHELAELAREWDSRAAGKQHVPRRRHAAHSQARH